MIYQGREYSDADMEKKRIFLERFRMLVGEKTAKEIVPMLQGKVKQSTISNWISDNPVCPTRKNLDLICKVFDVDYDYLLSSDTKDFNNMYEKIAEITGLSSKAIAVLESIHNNGPIKDENGIMTDTPESFGRSQTTIDLINYVLEKNYDSGEYMLFDYIYRAIFLRDFISSKDDMTGFIHPETFEQITASKRDLFQTYNMNQVTKWIMDHYQEEERKQKKDKQPVENDE